MSNDKNKIAEYWSENLAGSNPFSPDVYWLAVPEVQKHYQKRACANKPYPSWIEYCVKEFLGDNIPVQLMLSIGCGTGSLERHLFSLNSFQNCHAIDIASKAIDTARQYAAQLGIDSITYSVHDVEAIDLGIHQYDVVWFNGSLHHIKELEAVCNRVKQALKPGGWLFFNEYVGFNRFAFSSHQLNIIHHTFYLIPLRYRRSFIGNNKNTYQKNPPLPDPKEVARTDPSEAVRSQDILPVVNKFFDIVTINKCGGSILQFLLSGIAGNFTQSDPQSMLILNMLLNIENTLIDSGDIQSDFVVVAARANLKK